MGPLLWGLAAVTVALAGLLFRESLGPLVDSWDDESHTHGVLIPFIAAFLIWQKKDELEQTPWRGSWTGTALVGLALVVFVLGELAALYKVGQYAFVLLLGALLLAMVGWRPFSRVWTAVFILLLAIPLPGVFYAQLSLFLQNVSSEGGVWLIRMAGIEVLLEGNVIDLGPMQLEVAEACNGLRYLFPLLTLGFIAAYFYQGRLWQRVLLFLSILPITVAMNSIRIGLIGITVEHWGLEMAEGLIHDLEGWVFFVGAFIALMLEVLLLSRLTGDRRPLRDILGLVYPAPTPAGAERVQRAPPRPFLGASALVLLAVVAAQVVPERTDDLPDRRALGEFPLRLGDWHSTTVKVDQIFLDALQNSDHLMRDFAAPGYLPVNLWIDYYDNQRKGRGVHSPEACLPAGGYEIAYLDEYLVPGVQVSGKPLVVNRSLMTKGDQRELVYFFFPQRGRLLTWEYEIKWYILWDALTRNRTDGALVRLIAPVPGGADVAEADRALTALAAEIAPILPQYVPD
jgi:exosortase D (VPLPA-CTERM-specific)